MQSVVAVACKILRIFYAILTKGVEYDPKEAAGRHQETTGTDSITNNGKTGNALSQLD